MADTIGVSVAWYPDIDPDLYWFSLSVDNGVESHPIPLGPSSVVVVQIQQGPNNWLSATLEVAPSPDDPGFYVIKTTVPAPLANGQERTIRVVIDGVTYGPWSFRFYGAGVV